MNDQNVKDERGQEQPTDKKRAQQTNQQGIPSDNINQINAAGSGSVRGRFSPKPELDERTNGGLRDDDKRQTALVHASLQGESRHETVGDKRDVTLCEQRTAHEAQQQGANIRAPFLKHVDTLPEGLRRERTHPLSPTEGRGGVPCKGSR